MQEAARRRCRPALMKEDTSCRHHTPDVLVVGSGIAGLAATVSALEGGATVTVLERAPREERGGQTRYTEAYLRMKSESEVTDDFEEILRRTPAATSTHHSCMPRRGRKRSGPAF